MNHLLLYVTSGCHLCEQAQQLIYTTLGTLVNEADIIDDERWYQRYSLRIPVLLDRSTGTELDWPFDQTQIAALVKQSATDA
jgi:hypothetical protein